MCDCKMDISASGASTVNYVDSSLEQASNSMLLNLRNRCEELDDALFMLDSTKKEIEGQINQCFQTILRTIEERRKVLFSDLESSLQKRRLRIEELMKAIEERSQKLTVTTEMLKQHYNGSSVKINEASHEIDGKTAEDQLRFLLATPIPIHPSTSDILSYFPIDLDKLLSLVKNFGAIGMTSVDTDRTSIYEDELESSSVMRCVTDEVYFHKVRAVDSQGRDVTCINPKEFTVSLTHRPVQMNEATAILTEQKHNKSNPQNELMVRLKLSNPGFYELNVKVLGEHIRNSPYRVHCLPRLGPSAKEWKEVFNEISDRIELRRGALQYIRRSCSEISLSKLPPLEALADKLSWNKNGMIFVIGARGRGNSEFAYPQGAMFTRDSKLVIADSNNSNIQVFDSSGAFVLRIGEFGSEAGQMIRPTSVAETINCNYLISDFDMHCIHVFQPSGSYMSRFGQRNLAGPNDVAVDSKGKIFVVDLKACAVCFFKPTGRFLGHFGSRGGADYQFVTPTGLAIDSTDRLYVVDSLAHAIKVFDNSGEFLFKFGVNGCEAGCLHMPTRAAFDSNGLLYISDTGNSRVQVFDKEGQYLWMLTSPLDSINEPRGLAILSSEQLIVVVDTGNYRIKAFNLKNRAAECENLIKESIGNACYKVGKEPNEIEGK